jgi:hypothetical protein
VETGCNTVQFLSEPEISVQYIASIFRVKEQAMPVSAGFLLDLLFDPEDEGGMLLANVGP